MKLMNATLRRLWRLTRATSIVVGLAVMVGLVAGVASLAVAGPSSGGSTATAVLKGVSNTATAVTTLINSGTGAALNLQVQPGNAPLTVNRDAATATNLSADKVDGKDSTSFVSATNGKAPDSELLDGKDSTAYGVTIKSAHEEIGDDGTFGCTPEGIYSECAPVTVKVPAGEQYHVTVFSSFVVNHVWAGTPDLFDVTYCPAIHGGSFGLSCITTGTGATAVNPGVGDSLIINTNGSDSAAISGDIGPLPAGTYTFSTAIKVDAPLSVQSQNEAHTTVMVRDASVPGPPIQ